MRARHSVRVCATATVRLACAGVCLGGAARVARAQLVTATPAGVVAPRADARAATTADTAAATLVLVPLASPDPLATWRADLTRRIGAATPPPDRLSAPWWAPLASAAVPGTGQAVLGQDRWIGFAAIETFSWLRYLGDRREAERERRNYRRIANQVARALYTTGRPAAGSFEYYETMEKWVESGVFDAMPGGAIDPEPDTTTFNGATWLLARQTYWPDPDEPPIPESMAFRNAMAFYERRAIRPEFRWSWRDAQLQQDLYRRAIFRSNAAFRRAAQDMAAVLANHVLSTVDAYVTVRLRRRPGPNGGETRLEATLPWPTGARR